MKKNLIFYIKQPQNLLNLLFYAASVVLLLFPAVRNGYPLLYSDSATYILSGPEGNVPIDRPIIYSLIVWVTSMSSSLWFTVTFQSLILVLLINRLAGYFTLIRRKSLVTFSLVLFLALFTGISNYTSQIMPDIFTGILILAFILLFAETNRHWRWLLWMIILVSSVVHFSNILLVTTLSLIAIAYELIFNRYSGNIIRVVVYFASLALLPWILLPSVNYLYTGEYFLSKSGPVFFTGRLIETGCLKDFFDHHPEAARYSLYADKDHLPERAFQFVWNDDSPLYKGGCRERGGWTSCWSEKRKEYGNMISDALSDRRVFMKFARITMIDWMKQLIDFDTGLMDKQGKNSAFAEIIPHHLDDEKFFISSRQYQETVTFNSGSKIQRWCVGISVMVLCLFLKFGIHYADFRKIRVMLIMIVTAQLANAFYCSTLSGVLNRYQGRTIWLIPLFAGICIWLLMNKSGNTNSPDKTVNI